MLGTELTQFLHDTDKGLSRKNKALMSKYFYDEKGCELFNAITRHPSYYLTTCEISILNKYKQALSELMRDAACNLIELGPGEGIKTNILINQFLHDKRQFSYVPIDISPKYLREIGERFMRDLPMVEVAPLIADYFAGLQWQREHSERRNLVLFLGSSVGNFNKEDTTLFLKKIHASLNPGDYFLIGFDLIKDHHILKEAYNDDAGLTREFNLNHLRRINSQLAGNFNLDDYNHHATFNTQLNAMESFLISRREHEVYIEATNKTYRFNKDEPIHMEYSHKYNNEMINAFAKKAGFNVVQNYMDDKEYFVDSLWRV